MIGDQRAALALSRRALLAALRVWRARRPNDSSARGAALSMLALSDARESGRQACLAGEPRDRSGPAWDLTIACLVDHCGVPCIRDAWREGWLRASGITSEVTP